MLIEAAQYGDQFAYEELLKRSYIPVKKYCSAMVSFEHADDLAQETFLRALKSKTSSENIESVEAFMIHIAKFVCCDFIKEKAKVRKINNRIRETSNLEFDTVDIDLIEIEADEECEQILSLISENLREAFVLTQILSFSYEECSEMLQVPIGTIRSRVSRAKDSLRATLTA